MSSPSPELPIALDAMGSDLAPQPELEGALEAARESGTRILLVGPVEELQRSLEACTGPERALIELVPATEVIRMDEKVMKAVRSKKDSSIHVACRLVRDGRAAAVVSAGNTGAVMATAKMILGSLPGVQRPALAAAFPTAAGTAAVLLDVGANVDCRAEHLEQFGVMGEIFYRAKFHAPRPRVGLLSIGAEESKGNELTREAFGLLKALPIDFVGNVEGRDLYNGQVDVIVCDGFVGNVALKISEGLVETVRSMLKEALGGSLAGKVGYALSRKAYAEFKKRLDYTEYGGAPLLGLRGVVTVSHGSSNAHAIKNAIRVARELYQQNLTDQITREIARLRASTVAQSVEGDA